MQRNDRSYKDLKQKQKSAIADKTYKMYLKFYLENQRMPDAAEMKDICKRLFTAVQSLAPKTEYEEFYKIVEKREKSYEERILRDIQKGITLETFMAKKHKKTPEEKAAVAKQKKQQRRAKRKKEVRDQLNTEERMIIYGIFFENKTQTQMAEIMGIANNGISMEQAFENMLLSV